MNEGKQATGTKDDFNHDPTAPSAVKPENQIGEEDKVKKGTEGTIEELGGKKDAGPPSGLDKGALEKGGEAQGTISSPGPTAQEVAQYHSQVNGNVPEEAERPGIEKFWKVSARMEPHLQLMYVSLIRLGAGLISGVDHYLPTTLSRMACTKEQRWSYVSTNYSYNQALMTGCQRCWISLLSRSLAWLDFPPLLSTQRLRPFLSRKRGHSSRTYDYPESGDQSIRPC